MDIRLVDLPWLIEPPEMFRSAVRALSAADADVHARARRLAGFRLNGNQLYMLGRVVNRLAIEYPGAIKLGVLSNNTADLVLPALVASCLRHGVWVHAMDAAFDQVAAEALNPDSQINAAGCHFVLLAVDHRGLPLVPTPGDEKLASTAVEAAVRYIDSLREALRHASGCTVIVQTVPQVTGSLFGSFERSVPGTLRWLIDEYNRKLRTKVAYSNDLLLDAASLAEAVGLERWHDPSQWTLGKFPFAHAVMPLYADWVGRLLGAARGKARKCLVVDLDNTLWGGVIGDDGLAGIVLGNGDPTGEAYLQIQQTVLALRDRGIVIAVSSKNDDAVARSPFRSHPEMLLKERHVAVFQANWQDKASNLEAIAATLNIGLDSIVLLDDNPAERAQVRDALPEVAVPELPQDPALFPDVLLAAGYFEATGFTAEDRLRAAQYAANAARSQALGAATDLGAHLQSLEMKAICGPFDPVGRARIAQLINKSNQFNLTTRRYTTSQVESFERSSTGLTLQVRLTDRFGDNGMVAVVICVEQANDWVIDTWLMSCRVLNRQLERAMLNYIVTRGQAAGVRALIGEYLPTARNGMVKEHYARLGFEPLPAARWRLEVTTYAPVVVPIAIVNIAVAPAGEISGAETVA